MPTEWQRLDDLMKVYFLIFIIGMMIINFRRRK